MKLTAKQEQNFFNKVLVIPGSCHEWIGSLDGKGYGTVRLNSKNHRAHRVAFCIQHGYMPNQLVLHHCDNPVCVNPNHLYEGDHRQNTLDARNRGRLPYTKLTCDQVREIKSLLALGELTQKEIGRKFNVTFQTISDIKRERRWQDVCD